MRQRQCHRINQIISSIGRVKLCGVCHLPLIKNTAGFSLSERQWNVSKFALQRACGLRKSQRPGLCRCLPLAKEGTLWETWKSRHRQPLEGLVHNCVNFHFIGYRNSKCTDVLPETRNTFGERAKMHIHDISQVELDSCRSKPTSPFPILKMA